MGRFQQVTVTTTGTAGSATGYAETDQYHGELWALKMDFSGDAPGTTTVVVAEIGGAAETILTLSAGNTDATYYPSSVVHTAAGAAVTNASRPILLTGTKLRITVANSDALAAALVVSVKIKD